MIIAEAFFKALKLDMYFTVPGRFTIPLNISLEKIGANKVMIPDERCAGHAADGYARVSGKPAGLVISAGPGALNATLPVATAFRDNSPMVLIVGDVPTYSKGSLAVEEVELVNVFKPICKKLIYVGDEEGIAEALRLAEYSSRAPKRPVLIDFPLDVQEREARLWYDHREGVQKGEEEDVKEKAAEVAKLLKDSKRPLILVGNGCLGAHDLVAKFAEKYRIPMAYTLMGWCMAWPKPSVNVGFCGVRGFKAANRALQECDLLIALGARLSEATIAHGLSNEATVIQILVDDPFHKRASIKIRANCESFVKALLERYDGGEKSHWVQYEAEPFYESKTFKIITRLLRESDCSVLSLDMGQSSTWALEAVKHGWSGPILYPGGLATMGFSIPAAIGAQLAKPNGKVLSITGDGGALMNLPALHVISKLKLPIIVAVFNNEVYGMVRSRQLRDYGLTSDVEVGFRGFREVAEATGMRYLEVKEERDLEGLGKGPLLIEVKVDADDAPPTTKKLFPKPSDFQAYITHARDAVSSQIF
ncbi:MAG: thiamine pyrophosphate-binding protein [Candidatus Nezhaarchaeota archaeon]|nr:thiamine pyrophosphate-binding protein [Candidatus Nezhaarchaeota archaeon]